jgi:hypothetical protein
MKKYILLMVLWLPVMPALTQNITATKQARLEVYALKSDGSQVVMTSDALAVTYDQLIMNGEVVLSSFQTENTTLQNLLDSASSYRITFSGVIPEGEFIYRDALQEQFTVETVLQYGEVQSKIIIGFEISNRKTSLANTFDITGTGSISLRDDLGITRATGLDDKISFRFFQNVQTKTY